MSVTECEALLGPRGALYVNSANRATVQKWLVAKGVPATVAKRAKIATLAKAYNDTADRYLSAIIRNHAGEQEQDSGQQDAAKANGPKQIRFDDAPKEAAIDAPKEKAAPTMPLDTSNGAANGAAVPPVTSANGDAAALLQQAFAIIAQNNRPQISREEVAEIVSAEIKRALAGTPPLVIEVRRDGDLIGRIEGRQHPKFAALLKAASARDASGFVPNVWLAGPAGSGKTRAVHNVATALSCDFEHNGALAMPHELLGFIDAAGTYHTTAFRRAYEHGAVYLFDEVDGSDNAALLALNAALANGTARFPDRTVERHPDSRIFAAANTWGMGATAEFVGRARIDAAFLDRFPVRIFWDYDDELEIAISGNPDFARRVQRARAQAAAAGLKVAITPRASIAGAALIAAGFTPDEAAEMTYLANLTREQRQQIEA